MGRLSLEDTQWLSRFHCLSEESWEGLSCSLEAPALESGPALVSAPAFSLCGMLWNHRKELSWPSCRDACSWRQGRVTVLISTVMRLIKSLAAWSGWAEQGLQSREQGDLRISNSLLLHRSCKNGNLHSPPGVAPLHAWALR